MIQQLGFQLSDGPEGDMLADFGHAERVEISDGEHGFEALSAFIPMTEAEAFRWYAMPGVPWATLTGLGGIAWEGRVEDVAVVDGGLEIGALGAWRALSDAPYTALWSRTTTAGWRAITPSDMSTHEPARYEIDNNNRLYVALRNGETYGNLTNNGGLTYAAPHNGQRNIVAFSARYDITLPTNWVMRILRCSETYALLTTIQTITGTGANQTGVIVQTFTGDVRLVIEVRNSTGGSYTMTGNTGTFYVRLTNIRITTTTANYVNTTLGTGVLPGTWAVTPASMANIYVGQSLIVAGAGGTEMVTVTAVTATTFTATFALAHGSTDPVVALVVYGGEVAAHLVSVINAINSNQLRNVTALIQSPNLDLSDELYEDEWPQDILTSLAQRGDRDGNQYEVGVWENRTLHLRPRYSASRTWLVDAVDLTVNRSMDNFRNQMYAVYRGANNRLKRTAVQTNGAPLVVIGDRESTVPPFSRRSYINTQTTSLTQAERERDVRITDTAVITPRAGFRVEALYDEAGAGPYPLWMARAGDLVIIHNLSPGLGTAVDRLRNFRIKRKRYIVTEDVLELTPELELPDLAVMASESLTAADRTRPYTRIEG